MGDYLVWLLIASITLSVLYIFYRVLLSHLKQPEINRRTLVVIYLVSPLSPFIYDFFAKIYYSSDAVRVVAAYSVSHAALDSAKLWLHLFSYIYVLGVAAMAVRLVIAMIGLRRKISRGEKIVCDTHTLVVVNDEDISPFSWRKYIIVNRQDFDGANLDMIVTHELTHLKMYHWIDLMLADVTLILQWFNPMAWLMKDELKDIHEFQADEHVISAGYDEQEYQLMLISAAVGHKISFIGNSLRHGKLKRRFLMLDAGAASKAKRLRILVFPLVFFSLAVAANLPKTHFLCDNVIEAYNFDRRPQMHDIDEYGVYLDGEKIDRNELDQIDPSIIKQITVNKRENTEGNIYIETK